MISVIIPIYNGEKTLERMLESIKAQSYKELEIIMIDDGSRDKSREICIRYVHKDRRFHYYQQQNLGASAARNNGLKRAKGEYIAFLDADDWIDDHYFEELLLACKFADLAVCDVAVECEGAEILSFTMDSCTVEQAEAIQLLLMRTKINSGPCGKLFKREVIGNVRFTEIKAYEDMIFNLSVFSNAERISATSKTKYHYIENPNGTMSSMARRPSKDIIKAADMIMEYIVDRKELKPECCYITISHLFQYVLPMMKKETIMDKDFILEVRKLYKKYRMHILKCPAFPWKEKMMYIAFVYGWLYADGRVTFIRC